MKRKILLGLLLAGISLGTFTACDKRTQNSKESEMPISTENPVSLDHVVEEEQSGVVFGDKITFVPSNLYPEWPHASLKTYTIGLIKNEEVEDGKDDHYDYIYKKEFQSACDEGIIRKKSQGSYTVESPLAIINPYGTLTNSLYLFFNTKEACEVEYTISAEGTPDFTRTLYNGKEKNLTKEHEYTLIGFVRNKENTVKLRLKDKSGTVKKETSFTISMPDYYTQPIPAIEVTKGTSKVKVSEGLYALLGYEMRESSKTLLVDNDGIIRAEMLMNAYRMDEIKFLGDKILYPNSFNQFVVMNRLGKLESFYSFDSKKYEQHHDFEYDETTNSLIVLVNDKESDSIEDVVLQIDMTTGESKELLNFKELFPEVYEKAALYTGENVYGGKEIDWIHLNSISITPDGTYLFSARELNTVIAISNLYKNPSIKYLIGNHLVWDNTPYSKYAYNKVGDFVDTAGQHTANYAGNEGLETGQYYINIYNNNYLRNVGAKQMQDMLLESGEFPGVAENEKDKAAEHSYYYKYLVDENAGTYELVSKIPVDFSGIVSSSQDYDGNVVVNSGRFGSVAEYDVEGNLINHIQYEVERHCYRAFKYSFEGVWFK